MIDGIIPVLSPTILATPFRAKRRSVGIGAPSMLRKLFLAAAALLCVLEGSLTPTAVRADERLTHQYFEELRERRLFDIAEGFAIHRLSQPKLPLRLQWDLSRELAATFDEHARYTTGDEQTDLWQRARQVLGDLAPRMTGEASQFVLDSELAMLRVRQAEFLLEELDLFPHDEALRDRVRRLVGEANQEFKELYIRSERLLRRITAVTSARSDAASSSELVFTARDIHSRIYAVRYHRARALWQQIQLRRFDAGHPREQSQEKTRDDAISKSLDVLLRESSPRGKAHASNDDDRSDPEKQIRLIGDLLKAIAEHDPPSTFTWAGRLLMIECRMITAETGEMERLIGSFAVRDLPETVRAGLEALRARCLIREGRFEQALQHILDYRKDQPVLPGELFYWQQKSLAGLANLAKEKQQNSLAEELLQESDTQARRAVETIGGYWGDRCRILAEQLHESLRYGVELARALQTARLRHRQGDMASAAPAYRTALQLARQNQHADLESELSLALGGILLEQNEFSEAAVVLRSAAESQPAHPEAARIDILHAYALGKMYEAGKTPEYAAAYAAALEHHRQTFRGSDTAGEATWMLAQLKERQNEPANAIAYYKDIPTDHMRRLDADVGIARSFEKLLDPLREQETDEARRKLRDRQTEAEVMLLSVVQNYPADGTHWNREQAEVALRTARMLLNHQPTDYDAADRLLSLVLAAHAQSQSLAAEMNPAEREPLQTAWSPILHAARQLRILSLAGQNQPRKAMLLVEQLAEEHPQDVLLIVLGISSITSESSPQRRRQIGELQLHAAQLLQQRREELSEIDQARLDQCLAEAYAATDQPMKSIEIYESLLRRFPKDKRLQKTTAELLIDCGSEECLKKALSLWRSVEKREKEGTPAWIEARYYVAWCYCELEQYDDALKLLKVTRLLYPDLEAVWKARFTELETKCRPGTSGDAGRGKK